jgi:hypothetical protein
LTQRYPPGTKLKSTQIKKECSKILRKTETGGHVACIEEMKAVHNSYDNSRAENTFET